MKAYIKFFGSSKLGGRAKRNYLTRDEIKRSECHCVAGFSRRPLVFEKGDIIYMGRMVSAPNDYIVFGKGIVAEKFSWPRDEATAEDKSRVTFRKDWSYYIQMAETIFIDGPLYNGIPLENLIQAKKTDSFERAQHLLPGTSIRTLFMNKSYVQLTRVAVEWLNQEMEKKIIEHNKVGVDFLRSVAKPEKALCNF